MTYRMNRKSLPALVAGTVAASLAVTVLLVHPRSSAQTSGGSWIPYQIAYKSYAGKPGSPPVLVSDAIRAVRSDGATVELTTLYRLDGAKNRLQRVLALPGGIRIRTDESLGIMTATRNPAEDGDLSPSHRLDPSKSCLAFVGGGGQSPTYTASLSDIILGYTTYQIAADLGRYRNRIWRAPSLGCAELHSLGERIDTATGQVIGTSESVAISVQAGEPDPKLFTIPSGLKNLGPVEMTSMQADICCHKQLSALELAPLQPAEDHFQKFRYDF